MGWFGDNTRWSLSRRLFGWCGQAKQSLRWRRPWRAGLDSEGEVLNVFIRSDKLFCGDAAETLLSPLSLSEIKSEHIDGAIRRVRHLAGAKKFLRHSTER